LPTYTNNDVDIWVSDYKTAKNILITTAKSIGLKLYIQNETANGSNNYFYYLYNSGAVKIVKIDLMIETAWKSIFPIFTKNIIMRHIVKYNNFYIIDEYLESGMHLLYPLIHLGIIKEQYKSKLHRMSNEQNFKDVLEKVLNKNIVFKIITNIKDSNWQNITSLRNQICEQIIVRTFTHINLNRVKIFFLFIQSMAVRVIKKNGVIISLSGIDGAGKSTVMDYFSKNSNNYFPKGKIKTFYWRPFLLPRLSTLLHVQGQKENINVEGRRTLNVSLLHMLKYYIKYFYYVVDFLLGKLKYFYVSHTGGIVIFDRYHIDNIIYPERFGFKINIKIMRFFDKYIIPQPDILFFVVADTNILLSRKQELSSQEIDNQKNEYKKELDKKKKVMILETNSVLNHTIMDLLKLMFNKMNERYK